MTYPSEILPHPRYKLITCDLSDFFLVRHTNIQEFGPLLNEYGDVSPKHIAHPSERMDDLSMNLLGVFQPNFTEIEITPKAKEYYNKECEPNSFVRLPIFMQDFVLNRDRTNWFLKFKDFDGYVCDFTKGPNQTRFTAKCEILHSPMRWNYWHFSIRWNIEGVGYLHNLEINERKKFASKIGKDARSGLVRVAKDSIPTLLQLSKPNYLLKIYSRIYIRTILEACMKKRNLLSKS